MIFISLAPLVCFYLLGFFFFFYTATKTTAASSLLCAEHLADLSQPVIRLSFFIRHSHTLAGGPFIAAAAARLVEWKFASERAMELIEKWPPR